MAGRGEAIHRTPAALSPAAGGGIRGHGADRAGGALRCSLRSPLRDGAPRSPAVRRGRRPLGRPVDKGAAHLPFHPPLCRTRGRAGPPTGATTSTAGTPSGPLLNEWGRLPAITRVQLGPLEEHEDAALDRGASSGADARAGGAATRRPRRGQPFFHRGARSRRRVRRVAACRPIWRSSCSPASIGWTRTAVWPCRAVSVVGRRAAHGLLRAAPVSTRPLSIGRCGPPSRPTCWWRQEAMAMPSAHALLAEAVYQDLLPGRADPPPRGVRQSARVPRGGGHGGRARPPCPRFLRSRHRRQRQRDGRR